MRNRSQYLCGNTTGPKTPPNFGGMMVGTVAAGAMSTLWKYARQQKPYRQCATLAPGGAAVSIGQQLVRGAEGCLSVSGHAG
jgi:hypothetical protein